jgi:hypothetical protein
MINKFHRGNLVWLAEFDNGTEKVPRQKCFIICYENEMYTGKVIPEDQYDDGLREFSEDQIEGAV